MGRGSRIAEHAASSRVTPQQRELLDAAAQPPAPSILTGAPLDIAAVFAAAVAAEPEPDWRLPNGFYVKEAGQFVDPANAEEGGLPLDPAVALKLVRLRFNGNFARYRRWYLGARSNIVAPEKTVPGMNAAGGALSDALTRGETIAVYCDYDVDGTSGGEALRRALTPYLRDGSRLYYGYADAQAGFGLTNAFVHAAHAEGAKVLITLDCGSGQTAQVRLAQSLGMLVFVVDHHGVDPENPAEHHLNPHLQQPMSSHNTGAQLAWKLGAATQIAREGRTRPEHWEHAMFAAGMGCLADMGSVMLEENRTFFWSAAEHVPPGVVALAEAIGETPAPGCMIRTQACMNLPKRTTKVSADDVGALFAAENAEQAAPLVAKLLGAYQDAQPVSKRMVAEAIAQTGEKTTDEAGEHVIPNAEELIASVVLGEEYADYNGYSGTTANRVSARCGKPAFVFVAKGTDEHGQQLYRFSSRNDARVDCQLGDLVENEAMRAACTIKAYDEAGEIVEKPKCGGHSEVFSGTCTAQNIPAVMAAARAWATEKAAKSWYPRPWDGPDASLQERNVPAGRLAAIEEQARHFGPFTRRKELLAPGEGPGGSDRTEPNREVAISVRAVLTLSDQVDPDRDGWLIGELDLGDGVTREIRYPQDAEDRPVGVTREWLLRVGTQRIYWLRQFCNAAE